MRRPSQFEETGGVGIHLRIFILLLEWHDCVLSLLDSRETGAGAKDGEAKRTRRPIIQVQSTNREREALPPGGAGSRGPEIGASDIVGPDPNKPGVAYGTANSVQQTPNQFIAGAIPLSATMGTITTRINDSGIRLRIMINVSRFGVTFCDFTEFARMECELAMAR